MPIQLDNTNTGSVTLKGPASSVGAMSWPSANGTSSQALITDGSGNLSWVNLSSPALAGFTLTSASNSIVASGGTTNQGSALVGKGAGGFCLNLPDSTTTGGNARGLYSVDLSPIRSAASEVASGSRSTILGGYGQTASGQSSIIGGGWRLYTTGSSSYALGGNNANLSASNVISFSSNTPGSAYLTTYSSTGMTSLGMSFGNTNANFNNSQYSVYLGYHNASHVGAMCYPACGATNIWDGQLGGVTTSSSGKVLTTDGATAGTYNIPLYNGSTSTIRGEAIARSSNGLTKSWSFILGGTISSTGGGTLSAQYSDTGTSLWDLQVTYGSGSFTFTAIGDSVLTVRWFVRFKMV